MSDDAFISRWSRRKRGKDIEAEPARAAPAAQTVAPVEDERTDEEILQELELPDPDTLGKGDDFTAFMKSAVPTRLRNRALRRLWLSDPTLANLDELLDYGDDFTDAATVVENMQTAYQVGKGWLQDADEDPAPEAPAEEGDDVDDAAYADASAPDAENSAPPDDMPQAEPALSAPPDLPEVADSPQLPPDDAATLAESPVPRPRRMAFRFDT